MDIGVIGLGLIGGSLAKSIRTNTDNILYGYDRDNSVVKKAIADHTIDGELTDDKLKKCSIIIIALYPQDTVDYIESKKNIFNKDAIVMDTCGVKELVCEKAFAIAQKHGFIFIGAHPMAGIEFHGYDHSFPDLFSGASMILVPSPDEEDKILEDIRSFFLKTGFEKVVLSTPEEHDHIIAYTSQLAHVVSSAYVKSSAASEYSGFSAGSFQDMTRVAKLNETMWTELFMDNKEYLAEELDRLIMDLGGYRDSIRAGNHEKLKLLLREGRIIKERLNNEK